MTVKGQVFRKPGAGMEEYWNEFLEWLEWMRNEDELRGTRTATAGRRKRTSPDRPPGG